MILKLRDTGHSFSSLKQVLHLKTGWKYVKDSFVMCDEIIKYVIFSTVIAAQNVRKHLFL